MLDKKKIAIAGKNNIAIEIIKYIISKYPNISVCAVTNSNDNGKNNFQKSFKSFCIKNNIPIRKLCNIQNDKDLIFLSLEFDKIIKPEMFLSKQLYNLHFSLLPSYKGVYTSAIPILNNEKFSGVTLHKIDKGIDTGDIIAQKKFEIGRLTNGQELYLKYIDNGISLVIENLEYLINNNYKSSPQSALGSSYYSKNFINYKDINIDLFLTAEQIYNNIRAFYFPAFQVPKIFNQKIYKSEITNIKSDQKPSSIVFENDYLIELCTIDYNIILYKDKLDDLIEACKCGDLNKVINIYQAGYNVQNKTNEGWDALIVSTYNNHFEIVKFLINNANFDLNTSNYNGTTLLMYAMTQASNTDDTTILEYLLSNYKHLINLNQSDDKGNDVFYYAKKYNNEKVMNIMSKI